MPPYLAWWCGREVIAAFAVEPFHRYLPTQANGQAANAAYRWDAEKGSYVAEALEVLTLEGAQVKEMTAFMMPAIFHRSVFRTSFREREPRRAGATQRHLSLEVLAERRASPRVASESQAAIDSTGPARRTAPGGVPITRLNARANAASER
jgi:hypothetical protein